MIKISKGNSKLGKIPNISLVPVKDCGNCSGCKTDCYALKSYKQYPNVRAAWQQNSTMHKLSLESTNYHIRKWFDKNKPEYFRIHVAGDFLNQEHVDMWVKIAEDYRDTKFLAFTKMGNLTYMGTPPNLSIIASQWPGMNNNLHYLRYAGLEKDKKFMAWSTPKYNCPGSCTTCKVCWDTEDIRDIIFKKH